MQLQARASLGRSKRVRITSEHSITTAAFMCGFLMLWKASWKESKAVTWHYFDIAMSQQLLENFISTAGTSSMWKKKKKTCGNWECIDLHFVGLFLCFSLSIYFWLWEETGYWVRWSDPARQSDVLTINSSKTARGFMKIAGSWGMVGLKTH